MSTRLNLILSILKDELRLYLSISVCVFLFILFFQPFPLDHFDFNNKLLIVSGLGGIVFMFTGLVRTLVPLLINNYEKDLSRSSLTSFLAGFIMASLTSVGFTFYLQYVSKVDITFFIVFKVVLISLISPTVLWLNDLIKELKLRNSLLMHEKEQVQTQVQKTEDEYLNKSIELASENKAENLKLAFTDIAFIKTADNYVEVVYKDKDVFKKKLLRNTLKNIELQLKPYSIFIRCHRTCMVNSRFVEKLNRNYNNFWLSIEGSNEQIPVSRQYLAMIKDTL